MRTKNKGFTIIEVLIVLAIAALIFLIVFLAVPQLQRSRRDTQRRNDMARVGALLENFAANTKSVYPTAAQFSSPGGTFYTNYVNTSEFTDPFSNTTYVFTGGSNAETIASGAPAITTGQSATIGFQTDGSGRTYKICIKFESGGFGCQDVQ